VVNILIVSIMAPYFSPVDGVKVSEKFTTSVVRPEMV
jgi:hypothetical protein